MLTDLLIKKLPLPDKRREVPDGRIGGLYLIVQPSGAKSWAVRYRANGAPRKLTLGAYPAVDLATARRRAQEAIGEVAGGNDPAAQKQASRAAARMERAAETDRVETVAEQFIARHIRATMRPSWAREAERMVRKEIVGAWKGRRLSEIRKPDIHRLLDAIVDRPAPVLANRTLATFRRMCSWAIGRGIIEASPCDQIKAPAPERPRDRVLDDDELRSVWVAAEALGYPFGPLVQLLVLTGQRLAEVAEMRWAEVDLAARLWTIPAERCKNGRTHQLPLSQQALAILEGLPRIEGERGFVFTTNGKTPVSGFSKARARLGAALPDAPPFVLHDLRRSTATGMAKLGVDLHVIERCLNHVSGSFGGIVGVYQKHKFEDGMRRAMDAWARHLDETVSGAGASNVVELAKAPRGR